MGTLAVAPVRGELLVHVVRSKVEFLSLAMLRAGFRHEDLAIPLEDGAGKDAIAFWADALSSANESPNLLRLWQ